MRRHRRCEPIEAHVILATREDLWQALKTDPQGLTKERRKRLRELDALLKANARKMVKVLGDDLVRWRRRHKIPRSHWWWFLDNRRENIGDGSFASDPQNPLSKGEVTMLGRAKIAVIGAGMVGSSAALKMAQKELGDIVLVDVVEFVAEGKALDMAESAPLDGFDVALVGKTNDYSVIAGSDVVVITAGVARKPGMSRMDLLMTNAGIVEGIAQQIRQHAPDAIVIVVTNPLDVMTYIAWKVTGFSRERVMGQAGVLDSIRMRYFVAQSLGVSVKDVQAIVLGSHGDQMVPAAPKTHDRCRCAHHRVAGR